MNTWPAGRAGASPASPHLHVAAPISRLAFELGFEDPAYFCRFFKRRIGLGPREYRRAMAAIAER